MYVFFKQKTKQTDVFLSLSKVDNKVSVLFTFSLNSVFQSKIMYIISKLFLIGNDFWKPSAVFSF